jgi:SOS response regulatory protein OraA/RecX
VPTVTGLDADAKQGGGVRIWLDGASFATIGAEDVRPLALAVGAALSAEAVAEIETRAEVFSAHRAALRILTFRALPSGEIRRRLVRKGFIRPAADEAVDALVASGLINDHEFALHYARTRARRFRYGPGRLAGDLQRLGIAEREARQVVSDALELEGVQAVDLLREAAAKKLRMLRGLDPATRRRKLKIYLLRRGFALPDVIEVVKGAVRG